MKMTPSLGEKMTIFIRVHRSGQPLPVRVAALDSVALAYYGGTLCDVIAPDQCSSSARDGPNWDFSG